MENLLDNKKRKHKHSAKDRYYRRELTKSVKKKNELST